MLYQNVIFVLSIENHHPVQLLVMQKHKKAFNETISMDLHEIQSNIWYMHIIDELTRLNNAVII